MFGEMIGRSLAEFLMLSLRITVWMGKLVLMSISHLRNRNVRPIPEIRREDEWR